MLTDIQIKKFQELYKKHFGIEINKQEARERGARLVRLIKIVYQPNNINNSNISKNPEIKL